MGADGDLMDKHGKGWVPCGIGVSVHGLGVGCVGLCVMSRLWELEVGELRIHIDGYGNQGRWSTPGGTTGVYV